MDIGAFIEELDIEPLDDQLPSGTDEVVPAGYRPDAPSEPSDPSDPSDHEVAVST